MPSKRMRAPDPERDFAYSEWHRPHSISRFIDIVEASRLQMMDLDGVEIDAATNSPCAYIETTEIPVAEKQTRWTKAIATGAPAPGYVVQVVLSENLNPTVEWGPVKDIERFVMNYPGLKARVSCHASRRGLPGGSRCLRGLQRHRVFTGSSGLATPGTRRSAGRSCYVLGAYHELRPPRPLPERRGLRRPLVKRLSDGKTVPMDPTAYARWLISLRGRQGPIETPAMYREDA